MKGDLIVIDSNQNGEHAMTTGWCFGENARTKERGNVRTECVYILPALLRPPAPILALFTEQTEIGQPKNDYNRQLNDNVKPFTLEEYAIDHFRCVTLRLVWWVCTLQS